MKKEKTEMEYRVVLNPQCTYRYQPVSNQQMFIRCLMRTTLSKSITEPDFYVENLISVM
jgi:hypothetical protein